MNEAKPVHPRHAADPDDATLADEGQFRPPVTVRPAPPGQPDELTLPPPLIAPEGTPPMGAQPVMPAMATAAPTTKSPVVPPPLRRIQPTPGATGRPLSSAHAPSVTGEVKPAAQAPQAPRQAPPQARQAPPQAPQARPASGPPPSAAAAPLANAVAAPPAKKRPVTATRNTGSVSDISTPATPSGGVSRSALGASSASGSASASSGGGKTKIPLPDPGTRIDQYEVIRELGSGGMGAVFLARDTKLGRRVAIKFLHTDQPEVTARFFLEARVTAQFNHENIVVIHDTGEYQDQPYMVLEYLQGEPLSKRLKKGARLSASQAVEIMVPVVRALVTAHAHNIVHRDLKPDNIYITEAGTVKVLDFGIAKLKGLDSGGIADMVPEEHRSALPIMRRARAESGEDDDDTGPSGASELTKKGAIMGTLAYMSPEQWGIGVEVDHRSDIWAVGIMLYRMLTGRHPLAPLKGWQLAVTAVVDQPMPSMRDAGVDVPDALADIVDRCLIKLKEARMGSAAELLAALEPLLPGRSSRNLRVDVGDVSPYAGLSAFQESDADRFFGRSREIAGMVVRLRDQPLIGVVGPSGVGKSSFVRAGVVPALKHSGDDWEVMVVRPGRQPLTALAHIVAPLVGSETATTIADDLSQLETTVQRLANEPGYLGSVLRNRARRKKRKILLFVDQFEELYTMIPDYRERLAFTQCLSGVADDATSPLRVVVSLRSDFLDRAAEDPRFMADLTQGLFFLTPPTRDGMREALAQPARMAGYDFEEPQIVEQMISYLENTSGALPLLQFSASKLWDMRDRDRRLLTRASYEAMGGIAGALASHADAVLAELTPQAQMLVRGLFLRLITPERTRAIVSVNELYELSPYPADVQRLVDHLVQARLLVVQTGDSTTANAGPLVELVHESLIHSWPLLRRWLDENQDDAQFLEQLRTAAKQWQAKGYPAGLLWRGEAMEEARRWYSRYKGTLPELQKAYLQAVLSLELRSARRRRIAVIGLISVLTIIAAGAVVGMLLVRDAEKEALKQRQIAVHEAAAAREAQAEVQKKYEELDAEVKARRVAEEKAKKEETRAVMAEEDIERYIEELKESNAGLNEALEKAKRAKRRAKKAQEAAETNETEALAAKSDALNANRNLQDALERERKRAKELLDRLGSPYVEDLKE